ncbi:MAG: type II secretion system F family protein [Beijerinckiaceae bacterium]|nr:type II secretion system F family protein [Beijerinckiaceae bacterium]
MDKNWILILIFVACAAVVQSLYLMFWRQTKEEKAINRRLAVLKDNSNITVALEQLRRERWMSGESGASRNSLHRLVVQSGLRLNWTKLLLIIGGVSVVAWLPLAMFVGGWIAPLASIALGCALTWLYLQWARARRVARFGAQLADAVDVMIRSLRAGHPIPRALALVADEMADPAGTEFGIAADELTYGSDLGTAMEALSDRVGQEDLRFLVVAISIQSATGGSLAEILSNLTDVIRQRFKLRRKVRAISAEGRYSAGMLSILPLIFFGLLNIVSSSFYGDVWDDPTVHKALGAGLVLLMVGNVVMYRMVNYRV